VGLVLETLSAKSFMPATPALLKRFGVRPRNLHIPCGIGSECNPGICIFQAKKELVESYKRLRMEDAAPGSSTSYRITVRQLEALIRLSEALARLRCSESITPANVREVWPHPQSR
jgi:hypothetical protein